MSGHSKWSTIKRKKGAIDAKRSKLFSKLVKEIYAAAKQGGNNPDANIRLRLAIQNAKGSNVPKDNIERALKKSEESGAADMLDVVYEGYGPHGVGILVECLTDNLNRTVSYVRTAFSKAGGSLAKVGALSNSFDKKGVFVISASLVQDIDNFTLEMIDFGADSVSLEEDLVYITSKVQDFGSVQKRLAELQFIPQSAGLQYLANSTVELSEEQSESLEKLIDALEDIDDVQQVYHNIA